MSQQGQDVPKPPCPQCGRRDTVYWSKENLNFFCWKNEQRGKNGCGYSWVPGVTPAPVPPAQPTGGYTPPNQYPPPAAPAPPPPAAPPAPPVASAAVLTLTNARGQQVTVRIMFE